MNEAYTDVGNLREIRHLLDTPRSSFGEIITERLRIQSGWSFAYNLNPVFVNQVVANGGTVVHEGSFAKLSTGADPAGYAEINTKRALAYTPGVGAVAKFTNVFDTPQPNSKQLIGIGNGTDGWYFGYNGLRFGIVRVNNSNETWFYQENWSEDKKPDLNPQTGNVYQIDFQWLGFGDQRFSIEDDQGKISVVHKAPYSNRFVDVSVQNPSLPLTAKIFNEGNTTPLSMKTPSAIAGSYGEIDSSAFTFPLGFAQLDKSIAAGVETYLFSLRNPSTFLGKANRLYVDPTYISFASEGTKSVIIRIYFNGILANPNFISIEPDVSPLEYDEDATVVTPGIEVLATTLGKVANPAPIDLSILRSLISPGGLVTVTALSTNASLITTGVTVRSRV